MLKDYIIKHSKIVFPIIVIAAVAATVALALGAKSADKLEARNEENISTEAATEETAVADASEIIPMVPNEDPAITALINTFYNAKALGDMEALKSIWDERAPKELYLRQELSKYIEMYPTLEIYTKPGLKEGTTIVFVYLKMVLSGHEEQFPGYETFYVCTNEQGELYIHSGEISNEENEYNIRVMSQDDVIEFNNRVTVEYNELMLAKPELLEYLSEVSAQVEVDVGVLLAQENATETTEQTGEGTEAVTPDNTEATEQPPVEAPAENVVQYATATTTVNVRSSDSENADKLGKATGGSKLQILEQKVNGWTKVLFEGKEGYIKSEYLELAESAQGVAVVGTVTATTNINVRASANENAEKLGVLIGGGTADLLANENGWCKINYEGQVGYVKADYVEVN